LWKLIFRQLCGFPFRRAPEKLRAWQSASHIERAPVREAKEKDPKKSADSPLTPPA